MTIEPNTAIGTGLAILGSKEILTKILGPTADYMGGELKNFVEKCNINLDRIFIKAKEKLGPRLDEPGQVNTRVLKNVIEEGRFCEDEIVAEYLGGVLASSKTTNGRDDRGVSIISHIKNLSTYQIRLHYLYYFILYSLSEKHSSSLPETILLSSGDIAEQLNIVIPLEVYEKAMEFSENEKKQQNDIMTHSIEGLLKEKLIGKKSGTAPYISPNAANWTGKIIPSESIMLYPTAFGTEMFLYGNGIRGNTTIGTIKFKGENLIRVKNPSIDISDGSNFLSLLPNISSDGTRPA